MLLIAQAAQALAHVHSFKAKLSAQHYSRKHTRHQPQTSAAVNSSSVTACYTAGCALHQGCTERSETAVEAKIPNNSSSSEPPN